MEKFDGRPKKKTTASLAAASAAMLAGAAEAKANDVSLPDHDKAGTERLGATPAVDQGVLGISPDQRQRWESYARVEGGQDNLLVDIESITRDHPELQTTETAKSVVEILPKQLPVMDHVLLGEVLNLLKHKGLIQFKMIENPSMESGNEHIWRFTLIQESGMAQKVEINFGTFEELNKTDYRLPTVEIIDKILEKVGK